MTRSRQRTPITGITTAESEKDDKRRANRALRAGVRAAIAAGADVMPALREVSNVWKFAKDGKRWWPKHDMRK
jgi:hypothetical protein